MGERLRQRNEPDAAAKFFTRALERNPLDYRIYIGLAHAYLESSRFEDADRVLTASLPHAPRTRFDYRSVSYRLLGRIKFCQEQYHSAVEQLLHAVRMEPTYAKARYDLAQYFSCVGSEKDCVAALGEAIALNPDYWYAARAEPLFDCLRPAVDTALQSLVTALFTTAEENRAKAVELLNATQPTSAECIRLAGDLHRPCLVSVLVSKAKNSLHLAQETFDQTDYKAALAAAEAALVARTKASAALEGAQQEQRDLLAAEKALRAAKEAAERAQRAANKVRQRHQNEIAAAIAIFLLAAGALGAYFDHSIAGFGTGIWLAFLVAAGALMLRSIR